MAKVSGNVILHGASGKIGDQIVVRQTDHGIVLAAAPEIGSRAATPAQTSWREKFRHAVGYAKGAHDRPEYGKLAESRNWSTFNVATADFLHPPSIVDIDLSDYNGAQGDSIHVRVMDDVEVKEVGLIISNDQNVIVDKGSLTRDPVDRTLWHFKATKAANCTHVKLIVDAADLPGHVAKKLSDKTL
jgi:hypothetical protein